MKNKILSFICLLAVSSFAADSVKQSILQFRLVVEKPTADSEKVILSEKKRSGDGFYVQEFQIQKAPLLDGTAVKSAGLVTNNIDNSFEISIVLTEEGTKLFAEITRQHIGQQLAIFIEGKIYSAPRIIAEISGGKAQISGSFDKQEAEELARKINAAVTK